MSDRTPRQQLLDRPAPPRVRRGPARPIALATAALVIFSVLVYVLLNIDAQQDQSTQNQPPEDVIELIAPRGLSSDDLARPGEQPRTDIQPELARGGTIEIADPQTQQLVQRYRFESLDPSPAGAAPGWLAMQQPRMEIFLDNDRVVTLAGDSALAYRPHRIIESGTMSGNVIVKLFEGESGEQIDTQLDEPAWVITTDEASLDNFLGEIRCDGNVLISSDTMTLPGRGLRVLVDDRDNRIELRIAEPQYIRLVSADSSQQPRPEPTGRIDRASRSTQSPSTNNQPSTQRGQAQNEQPPARTAATRTQEPAQFYLLRLTDDVTVKQGDAATRRTARGDLLEIVFSTQSRGLESSLALNISQDMSLASVSTPAQGPLPLSMVLASMAYGSLAQDSFGSMHNRDDERLLGPDVTLIRCAGPLTITPMDDPARRPASPRDAKMEMTGSPLHLTDAANLSEAVGRTLAYETLDERVELIGSAEFPLHVHSPDLQAGGERFFLSQVSNEGGFVGAGWMTRHGALMAVDDPSDDPRNNLRDEQVQPAQTTELHITWQNGMDLRFGDGSAEQSRGGRLDSAHFRGDVNVSTDEFVLDADEMIVTFSDDADPAGDMTASSIESIHAIGSVRVLGVGDQGAIRAGDLHLGLAQAADGKTIPTLLVAIGDVEAIDDDQIIWCDSLRVSFREDENAEAQVDELLAERDVQVLLQDGTRAFADTMIGDGVSETLELRGEDVTIVSDKMVMDRGKRLVLDRSAGTATSPGPGSLRMFSQPILGEDRSRIARPVIDDELSVELRANWKQSMVYDSTVNDGAGSVDFRGDVDVLSNPTPLERNTMVGEALTIEFERVGADEDAAGDESAIDAGRGSRDIRTLIARQQAKIESQTFATPEQDGEPSIFYIAGDHVEFDALRSEALVAGAGELLIHDVTPEREGAVASTTPFGARGTTMLAWNRELRMTEGLDDVHDLLARGEVVLRHRDVNGTISWMTCERLDATVRRPEDEQVRPGSGGLDMGGSAELQRVRGSGGVIIRTEQRTVDCDSFDYDVASGIARIKAEPGRVVSIQTQGSPNVVTASEAIWNMERDSIRIIRAAGGG